MYTAVNNKNYIGKNDIKDSKNAYSINSYGRITKQIIDSNNSLGYRDKHTHWSIYEVTFDTYVYT